MVGNPLRFPANGSPAVWYSNHAGELHDRNPSRRTPSASAGERLQRPSTGVPCHHITGIGHMGAKASIGLEVVAAPPPLPSPMSATITAWLWLHTHRTLASVLGNRRVRGEAFAGRRPGSSSRHTQASRPAHIGRHLQGKSPLKCQMPIIRSEDWSRPLFAPCVSSALSPAIEPAAVTSPRP